MNRRSLAGVLCFLAAAVVAVVGGLNVMLVRTERATSGAEEFVAGGLPAVLLVLAVYLWTSGWSRYAQERSHDEARR